jgi:hypothetical protein
MDPSAAAAGSRSVNGFALAFGAVLMLETARTSRDAGSL